MKQKILIVTLLMLISIPTLVFAAYSVNSDEFHWVIDQLDMQGHADHELSTCSVKKVYYEEVVDMLNDGQSQEAIIQSYVDEYGQAALRTPGSDLTGLLAWLMPAIGLVVGATIIVIWVRKLTLKTTKKPDEQLIWQSDTDREIFERTMDEERRKFF
ncbi:MAG: cytochrome c-type biogenesis protein CcmH [Bacillus sp. (in: firmicutes)]